MSTAPTPDNHLRIDEAQADSKSAVPKFAHPGQTEVSAEQVIRVASFLEDESLEVRQATAQRLDECPVKLLAQNEVAELVFRNLVVERDELTVSALVSVAAKLAKNSPEWALQLQLALPLLLSTPSRQAALSTFDTNARELRPLKLVLFSAYRAHGDRDAFEVLEQNWSGTAAVLNQDTQQLQLNAEKVEQTIIAAEMMSRRLGARQVRNLLQIVSLGNPAVFSDDAALPGLYEILRTRATEVISQHSETLPLQRVPELLPTLVYELTQANREAPELRNALLLTLAKVASYHPDRFQPFCDALCSRLVNDSSEQPEIRVEAARLSIEAAAVISQDGAISEDIFHLFKELISAGGHERQLGTALAPAIWDFGSDEQSESAARHLFDNLGEQGPVPQYFGSIPHEHIPALLAHFAGVIRGEHSASPQRKIRVIQWTVEPLETMTRADREQAAQVLGLALTDDHADVRQEARTQLFKLGKEACQCLPVVWASIGNAPEDVLAESLDLTSQIVAQEALPPDIDLQLERLLPGVRQRLVGSALNDSQVTSLMRVETLSAALQRQIRSN